MPHDHSEAPEGIHDWVLGVSVPASPEEVRRTMTKRRSYMIPEKTWTQVQSAYCNWCGIDWLKGATTVCPGPHAEFLIGGNGPAVRAPRKHAAPHTSAAEVARRQRSSLGDLYG